MTEIMFRNIKSFKCDIACLQECYITDECVANWQREWGGRLLYSSGTAHSKGVVILI